MPRGDRTEHLIGLLLGTEEDWPRAFEELVRRLGAVRHPDGTPHTLRTERITIEPFDLRATLATTWSSTGWRTGTTTPASG